VPGSIVTSTVNEAPAATGSFGGAVTVVQPQPPLIPSTVMGAPLMLVIVSFAVMGLPGSTSPYSMVSGAKCH